MHLIRRKTLEVSVLKEHTFVTSFYIVVPECPWCPHIYKQEVVENASVSLVAFLCGHVGDLYSRKEESLVQQLYSITLLSTNAAPFW